VSVAIYARVSTDDQSVQQQLDRLRAAAPGATEYVDEAVSGRLVHRPAFDRLQADAAAGRVREVYASRLDRLGRSALAILEFLRRMEEAGVRVVLVDQQIDTSTPTGRVVRTVLAGMAELEADLGRDRTREAMRAIKAGTRPTRSGRPPGRPRKLTAEKEERIRELRWPAAGNGLPWKKIAQVVGLPWGTCAKVKPPSRGEPPRLEKGGQGFREQTAVRLDVMPPNRGGSESPSEVP
jgi:DNA invertase Pin-like site-specific DNA recombinase